MNSLRNCDQNGDGEKKTLFMVKQMEELGKVATDHTSGKSAKRANSGNGRNGNWKGVNPINLRSGLESESANLATYLGSIPGKIKSSGSQIWPTQNYSGEERLIWDRRNKKIYGAYANKDWPYTPYIDYSENGIEII